MKEALSENPEIHISDASPDAFKLFLDLICTDKLVDTSDAVLVHQVFLIARKYCLTRLQSACVDRISKLLRGSDVALLSLSQDLPSVAFAAPVH